MSAPILTDADLRALIVSEVGDYNGVVAANIDVLWSFYTPYAPFPPLQYLLAKRHATTMLAGQVWQAVDAAVDDTRQNLTDMHKALMNQLDALDKEIAASMTQLTGMAGLGVQGGVLVTTAPMAPPSGYPDANSAAYLGSVYSPYRGPHA
jgi:hypothetical protein